MDDNTYVQQTEMTTPPPPAASEPWAPPYAPAPRREYTAAERTLAWLCWGLGYLFWRWVVPGKSGVAVLLFQIAFLAVQIWFARRVAWQLIIPTVFALPFLLFDRGPLLTWNLLFLIFAGAMGMYVTYTPLRWEASDWLRGMILRPFSRFGEGVRALGSRREKKRRGTGVWWGLLIALPLTLLVGALLSAADEAFAGLLSTMTRPMRELGVDWPLLVPRLVVALPVALYLFGALYAGRHREEENAWEPTRGSARLVPPTVLLAAGIPVCGLYLLFMIAQSAYYFSAFSGLLPDTFTYAEYARQGFFELCAVAVINLLMLLAIRAFCRREEERLPRSLRVYGAVLCGFTLLLIATALRKMALYIARYGLTPLRVYTSWFMVLLGLVFLILAVSQFFSRVKPLRAVTAAFLVMFALLQFGNVNGRIAAYNVEQYRAGALPQVDVSLFYKLGDAAVPYAAQLLDDPDMSWEVTGFLYYSRARWEDSTWRDFNLTTRAAQRIVTELEKEGKL